MRFSGVLPVLSLLLGARASSLDLREPAPLPPHRIETRDAGADACYPANLRGLFPNLCVGSFLGVCICYPDAGALAQLSPGDVTTFHNLISVLLNPAGQSCDYPEYSVPACTDTSPCAFTCYDGYTVDGDSCVENSDS